MDLLDVPTCAPPLIWAGTQHEHVHWLDCWQTCATPLCRHLFTEPRVMWRAPSTVFLVGPETLPDPPPPPVLYVIIYCDGLFGVQRRRQQSNALILLMILRTDSNTLDILKPLVVLPCKILKIKHSDVCSCPSVALFAPNLQNLSLKPKPEVSDHSKFTQTSSFSFYFTYLL